ncbi:MAG TPA: adenylyl-sulfate kinase [Wenzhouxiangella sp.]|nr:adenylyl-sulfate kinase [Wenzhouxiangella sp.]
MSAPGEDRRDLLRFITCGSVDDGKSSLMGRLLLETGQVYKDQLRALRQGARQDEAAGADLALLVDGLRAEREQGITIDVAWRYFSTPSRKFIVADTPGHVQYTRNMASAASTADAAVVLIDAARGLQSQTRRHLFLCWLMGVRHVVVAVNKMDLVGYSQRVFDDIQAGCIDFAAQLDFARMHAVPVCAVAGDNVAARGRRLEWHDGPTLLGLLESLPPAGALAEKQPFRFQVQYINRHGAGFRGLCGTIAGGRVSRQDEVLIQPAGHRSRIKSISGPDGQVESALAGEAVTIVLTDQIDVGRGTMLADPHRPSLAAQALDANIVWMADSPLLEGRQYDLKIGSKTITATAELIHHCININNLEHEHAELLDLNDIALVRWRLIGKAAFDAYRKNRATGAFIVIDRLNSQTAGAGMIVRSVSDALASVSPDVVWHEHRVSKQQRSGQKAQRPAVLWFTGLSGAGKSSVANALEQALFRLGHHSYLLDGDNVRHGLSRDLGFTDSDRVENIRRIGEVARLMADAGLVVLSAFISPFRNDRALVRSLLEPGEFVEIYVRASLETCEKRDPKGLYARARAGEIRHFTGIDSPYEEPEQPELVIDTERLSVEESVDLILDYLRQRNILR